MARDALFPDGLVRPKAPYSPSFAAATTSTPPARSASTRPARSSRVASPSRHGRRSRTSRPASLAAGCTLDDVVKVNVFLVDLADFDAFNEVYRAAFAEPYPARTTVQAGLPGGIRVEIEAVARLSGASS